MRQILTLTFALVSTFCYSQLDKSYSRPEYSIDYPQKWTLDTSKKLGDAIFFYSPFENAQDDFSENVNLMIQNLAGQNINLSSYKIITEKQIATMAVNGKLIKSIIEKTAKGDRYFVEYLMTMNNKDLHIKSICYIKSNFAYLATFTTKTGTFEKYKKTGTEILDSFRVR